jgi:hypothetical protein
MPKRGTHVEIHHEVSLPPQQNKWRLCFQWCTYWYGEDRPEGDNASENGYRFIWRRPDNSLAAVRGQARIPSSLQLRGLIALAVKEGWFGNAEN